VQLRIGPLLDGGADDLVASAALPGIGNVLQRVADEIESEPPVDGGGEYLRIKLSFTLQRSPTIDRMEPDAS
jgi:hypothetical protein